VLHVKDGHNPLLALGNGLSVANDFVFDNGVIKGLTGPNSGGKSTYARTAIQLQILGQIGAPLPAQYARLSVADEMLYQAQSFNELSDAEGRFGEELKVTKGLFERATPKTFAVFDELAQGTTHEESRHVASYIIRGLSKLGINGVLITHDHELVESLSGEQVVEPVQAELRNDIPTHRIVGGISRKSHAERVAKKIGLGPEDVENFVMAARERHEIVMRETVQNKVSGLQD
jgi:DNA mismatch repair ATPase MutS